MTIYGDGHQTRDFTYIEDAIDAFMLGSTNPKAVGQAYNVGTGRETSVLELAKEIKALTGFPGPLRFLPKRTVDTVNRRSLDASKIQRDLGWKVNHTLTQGLQKTFQWLKEVN
jgi:UDP-glucose 4-epimerase